MSQPTEIIETASGKAVLKWIWRATLCQHCALEQHGKLGMSAPTWVATSRVGLIALTCLDLED
jgi:hypothetical protein